MGSSQRHLGVVTCGRADFGIYLPVLQAIAQDPRLTLSVIATGAHLSPEFGSTVQMIEAAGFSVKERVACLLSSDSPEGIGKAMGLGVLGFAQVFARWRPDILLVLGDRFDMHAAALAALPFKIPVAHIHGGELTLGNIDDALRHSMTKLSHLHFVATAEYAERVLQLGEEPWRVVVSGAPSLDGLPGAALPSPQELQRRFGVSWSVPPLLVTFHPVTLEYERTAWQVEQLLEALRQFEQPIIFTLPNADTNGRVIIGRLKTFVAAHPRAHLVENFGREAYFGIMACAAAMVGNSSSGIIEAASLGLPVVNVGTRQQGRVRAANVIDVGYPQSEIVAGLQQALSPAFRRSLERLVNPYGTGHASESIVAKLRDVPLDDRLICKRFIDLPQAALHAA